MKIKFVFVALLLNLFSVSVFAGQYSLCYNNPFSEDKSFKYFDFNWDEKWFGENSSYHYNHNIARAASCLAFASYSNNKIRPDIFEENFGTLGVSKDKVYVRYDVDYTHSIWGNDQVAFSIASKEINSAKGKKNLIIVVVRGTPLNANEWLSNLNIDDTNHTEEFVHKGFAIASSIVYSAIKTYLLSHDIKPADTYMLITGHSRGAAVSNLLAKDIYDEGLFKAENIYCYTFAAPNTSTTDDVDNPEYQFIFNIVNAEDIVPTVPLNRGLWRYRKYGRTLVLVNSVNVDQNKFENELLPRVNATYSGFSGRDYCPFRSGPYFTIMVTRFLSGITQDVQKYYKGGGLHKRGTKVFNLLFPSGNGNGGKWLYAGAYEDPLTAIRSNKKSLPNKIIRKINEVQPGFGTYIANSLLDMHACDVYMSHMLALEEDEAYSTLGYTMMVVHGSAEGTIVDEYGKVLARIINGRFKFLDTRLPVYGIGGLGETVFLGFPATRELRYVLTDNSYAPTPVKVTLEHFNSAGVYQRESQPQVIEIRKFQVKSFEVGTATLDAEKVNIDRINDPEDKKLTKKARLDAQKELLYSRDLFYSTSNTVTRSYCLGMPYLYGVLEAGYTFNDWGNGINLCTGAGTQMTLWKTISLDLNVLPKFCWGLEPDSETFDFILEGRALTSVKVLTRIHVAAGVNVDYSIDENELRPAFIAGLRWW